MSTIILSLIGTAIVVILSYQFGKLMCETPYDNGDKFVNTLIGFLCVIVSVIILGGTFTALYFLIPKIL
jgi:heme/copper-type cytochrome/quinol oxidase subunit 1